MVEELKMKYHFLLLSIITGLPLWRRGASDNGLDCQNSVLSVLRGDRTPTASSPYDSATVYRECRTSAERVPAATPAQNAKLLRLTPVL